MRCWLCVLLGLAAAGLAIGLRSELRAAPPQAPLLYSDDFEKGADRWEPSDPAAWKLVAGDKGQAYSQFKASNYKPVHRSPFNYSLVKDLSVGDFTLDARVQSTVKDYGHRDVCLFFGYQDPNHYYYVHLGKQADDRANQIFIVNGSPRVKISTTTTPGTNWTDGWHQVRIVRTVADGKIEVYFDDMQKPAMTAINKEFVWGRVGLGTFDDTANFDDVKIHGVKAAAKP